jgi:hypothetical protein
VFVKILKKFKTFGISKKIKKSKIKFFRKIDIGIESNATEADFGFVL